MSKNIVVDVDGVLLNWRDAFNQWILSYGLVKSMDDWDMGTYNPPLDHLPDELNFKLMKMFNQTHFVGKLAPIPGAIQTLQRAYRDGYTINVVTSFSGDYASIRLREQNLLEAYGPIFREITSLPLRTPKKAYLESQPLDSIYVEDLPKHLDEAIEAGYDRTNLFLIAQPWNSDFDRAKYHGIARTNWASVDRLIRGI